MYTKTDISSRALSYVGARRITDLTEKSIEAITVNLFYDSVLRDTIGKANWTAIRKRAILAADGSTPVSVWSNRFPLPSDCLDLIEVFADYELAEKPPYILEGGAILTNESAVDIVYKSSDILNTPALFNTELAEAFTLALAASIAPTLAENLNQADDLRKRAAKKIREASKGDSHRANRIKLGPSPWTRARTKGYSAVPLNLRINIV